VLKAATMMTAAKSIVRQLLPSTVYYVAKKLCHAPRRIVRKGREWITAFGLGIGFIATRTKLPTLLLFFGLSPGDDLLCTAVLRELRKRHRTNLLMISNHSELFNGGDATYVWPAGNQHNYISVASHYRRFARLWLIDFKRAAYGGYDGQDQFEVPSRHIIAEMCASVGIKGPIAVRPYVALTEDEMAISSWAGGKIVIMSSGMGARHPMLNKDWYAARFQDVVSALFEDFEFVQLGSTSDPPIRHARDLRGLTSLRQSAAILHNARLFVGAVGFLMHLARAVDCPSVIVYGGREAPWQSGYICNINIYSAVPCAPCWRANRCDFERRCMKGITVPDVVSSIRQMLNKPRNPLSVQSIEIR
jgi:hypothetical protein